MILVIEQKDFAANLIRRSLSEPILSAVSPENAAILIGRFGKRIGAIVTDVSFATGNIYSLVREARKDLGQDVPIISLLADPLTLNLLRDAGCSHVSTPLSVSDLLKELLTVKK